MIKNLCDCLCLNKVPIFIWSALENLKFANNLKREISIIFETKLFLANVRSMSRNSSLIRTGLAAPANSIPVNTPQVQNIIKNSSEKDVVVYEYEIVNKDAEERAGSKLARHFGYCMCRRWLFLLIGNCILIGLIMSTCGILLYVNTIVDDTLEPLTYLSACTSGSRNCDPLRHLECISGQCVCETNMIWNGTDCDCVTDTQYFDGLTW